MSEPKKITLKKSSESASHSGNHTGWKKKVTIPAGKRHAPHTAAQRTARPRKKSSGKGIVLGIFFGLLGCAALYGIYKYAEMKRIEARREAFALAGQRTTCDERFAQIPPLIAATEADQAKAKEMLSEVKEAVQFITGGPLLPPRKAVASKPAAAASTPAAAAPSRRRSAPPPTPADPQVNREAGHETVGGREAPEGIMGLAELEAMRRARDAAPQSQPPASTPTPTEPVAAPAAPAPTPEPPVTRSTYNRQPRVVVVGQQILEWQDAIAGKLEEMRVHESEADALRDEAYRAGFSIQAAKKAEAIASLLTKVENQRGYVASVVEEMRKGTDEILAIRKRVDGERKAQAEEARRRRLAEERKALVAREKARAIELHESIVGQLRKYAFTEAHGELEFAKRTYKTDEGRAALQVYVDRCARLIELKAELIRRLNEQPFRWGWGLGTVAKDVLGADKLVVRIKGEQIAWADVSLNQMKKFLDHYSKNDAEKVSWRATMLLGMAILFHENDRTVDAGEYCREASRLGAFLRDDAERLLPDYR